MDLSTRLEIVQLYYANQSSPILTLRAYKKKHGLHKDPFPPKSISCLIEKFETTYSLHDIPKSGRNSIIDDEKINRVRLSHELQQNNNANETSSMREISRTTDMSYSTVRKITREYLEFKKYKPTFVHALSDNDKTRRLEFATLFENQLLPSLDGIFWSDEAHFHLNGEVSSTNGYIWASEKPSVHIERHLHSPKLTVFVAFSSKMMCPPYFYPIGATVCKENYVETLRNHLIPFLKSKRKFSKSILMQDGATPHTANYTKEFLKANFGERVISNGFPIWWPARSPDLNPCDYWLWGDLKRRVYKHKIENIEELRDVIINEVNLLSEPMTLQNVVNSLPKRIESLKLNNGNQL